MEIEKYLLQIELFRHLPEDVLMNLVRCSKKILYLNGECITKQGDHRNFLWIVCKGKADVIIEKAGGERLVATLGPGEMVGEMSVFQKRQASATVVAHGKCGAIQIPAENFRKAISSNSVSTGIIAQKITGRFVDLMQKKKA